MVLVGGIVSYMLLMEKEKKRNRETARDDIIATENEEAGGRRYTAEAFTGVVCVVPTSPTHSCVFSAANEPRDVELNASHGRAQCISSRWSLDIWTSPAFTSQVNNMYARSKQQRGPSSRLRF